MEEAIFNLNGGRCVLLCSVCGMVIKTIMEFNEIEQDALKGRKKLNKQLCKYCKNDNKKRIKGNNLHRCR